ncbi:hypothetical protein HYX10_00890 [Candidatus Woesearchaeota archaeon]|nr:hypothetical protein [Candidatus Woesearchaeota archaeon]
MALTQIIGQIEQAGFEYDGCIYVRGHWLVGQDVISVDVMRVSEAGSTLKVTHYTQPSAMRSAVQKFLGMGKPQVRETSFIFSENSGLPESLAEILYS